METTTAEQIWTDEALMALPDDGYKYELVDGELVMSPAGTRHGDLGMTLGGLMQIHARRNKLGRVVDSSTGFRMVNGNVRLPDVSFISKARLRGLKQLPEGFFEGAPDLAVEILSPSDSLTGTHGKLVEYFESGARLAWIVNPVEATVLIYRSAEHPDELRRRQDTLSGEDVLPGFELPLEELFADLDF